LTKGKANIVEKGVNDMTEWLCEITVQILSWDALALMWKPKDQTLKLQLTAKQQWIESMEVGN